MERATEESTEDAARDIYAKDTVEDSDGPGPDRDRAHGSSGVHKDSDKLSTGNPPSTPVSTRSDAVVHRAMAAGGSKGSGRRQFPGSARLNTTGDAPSKHDNPLGNTTPSSSPLGNKSRGGPHTAGSDGEPKGTSDPRVHPQRASAATEYRPIPAMQATSSQDLQDLGPEDYTRSFYAPDESSLPDVQTSTVINELRAGKEASDKRYEALQVQVRDLLAHQEAKTLSKEKKMEATLHEVTEANRMLMRRMAAQDEERAVWAARTGAETVKTEHGEGDVDEPSNDKIPGLQADSEDEESDDEDGRGAPRDTMPSMPWPLPSTRVPEYTGSKHYEGANEAGAPARVENIQGDNKPSTSRRPPDPCLSVHAGTGSPDMNKLTHPSASEESVHRDDLGNTVSYLRLDRAGEFTSPANIARLERELKVTVHGTVVVRPSALAALDLAMTRSSSFMSADGTGAPGRTIDLPMVTISSRMVMDQEGAT